MEKNPTRRRIGITALILSLAVALTGCVTSNLGQGSSPGSSPEVSYPGFPSGVAGDTEDVPSAYADSDTLYLTIGGSSSCPPAPTALKEVNGVLEITITSDTEGACTADFVVTTHEIARESIPDQVVLVFHDNERQTLTVKRL